MTAGAALYLELTGSTLRLVTMKNVDAIIRKMSRQRQGSARGIVLLVVFEGEGLVAKVRRAIARAWRSLYVGGGRYRAYPADMERLVELLRQYPGCSCYTPGAAPSERAQRLIFRHFAGGPRSKWRGEPHAFTEDRATLDELMVAGLVTEHRRRKLGELEYRGTARCIKIAMAVGETQVPSRGATPSVETRAPISKVIVVPEPMMSRAEVLHQIELQEELPANKRAQLQPGYAPAAVNMRLLIGALAEIKGLSEAQTRGAQQFRLVADQAQIGAASAVDYEQVKVDTSTVNTVVEYGASAREQYHGARVALGLGSLRLAVAERMIIGDESARRIAVAMGYGSGGQARVRIINLAKDAATVLARFFRTTTEGRRELRTEGARPKDGSASGSKYESAPSSSLYEALLRKA